MSLLLASVDVLPSPLVSPVLTVALCAMAGVGTWLLLPQRGKSNFTRNIGAGMGLVALVCFALMLLRFATLGSFSTIIYFWIFSLMAIIGAVKVVTHRLPVYSALYFVMTVFASAGLFVLLWAEFLAAALVLIYAGAVLVTYTFVIMLASEASGGGLVSRVAGAVDTGNDYDDEARSPLLASIAGFTTLGVLLYVIFDKAQAITSRATLAIDGAPPHRDTSLQKLAQFLFSDQAVSVQLAGLILTLAMVGAIMIARRRVLLGDDERLPLGESVTIGPATPVDDNPHSVPVAGAPGPRSGQREAELMEL